MLFTVLFYHFLFSRYLGLIKSHFSSDILVPFPDSSDLYSHELASKMYAVKGKTWWAGIGALTYYRSYLACVNVNNLPENQVYSFYNLFGACTVFVDCGDYKIYQPLVQCLTPTRAVARKWTEQYNATHES